MKCDICRERNAVIFVQQVSKGSSIELHLCEVCAKERGFSATGSKIDISLGGLFSGILEGAKSGDPGEYACPSCGFTLADVRKHRRVGCADCYRQFRAEILSLLRQEGTDVAWSGSLPARLEAFKSLAPDPENLRKELARAIEREDYEMAAYYRDRLRALGDGDGR
jgi:protein arginine kinase activator